VTDGQVHRDRQGPAGVDPGTGLGEGRVQDVPGQWADQRAVLGHGDEVVGKDQAAFGVLPAHQGLNTDDVPVAESYLGLVVQHEFAALECPAQVAEQRELGGGVSVDSRVVGEHGLGLRLGHVHGDVRVLQQGGGVLTVFAGDHDPNAGLHVQVDALDVE